jgi:hypothetical protein
MTIIAASTVAGHPYHYAHIQQHDQRSEDDKDEQVASPQIWVGIWHIKIVGGGGVNFSRLTSTRKSRGFLRAIP